MKLSHALAARSLRRCIPMQGDHLRMLTASNLSAGRGELGRVRNLLSDLPYDPARGPSDSAISMGILLHARTQDDFFPHGRVHVGAITLASALALADETGDRLIQCLAAGYEVMVLTSEASSTYVQQRGLRPSGVFGPLGAAATAAVAVGLDEAGIANAIGLACALAGGTNQAWLSGTDEWMFVVAQAARIGVEAALLTRAGVRASEDALEGRAGWGAAYLGDPDLSPLRAALEVQRSRITDVAAKLYPVSGIAQLVAHLACEARSELASPVKEIVVLLNEAETRYPGSLHSGPFRGRADALMSVPFVTACGLTHGEIRLSHLERPNHAGVDHLLPLIRIEADSRIAEAEASLRISTGGTYREFVLGEEVMFPSWKETRAGAVALARRSEAPLESVEAILNELDNPHADARVLRSILLNENG